ncbi:MAG: methionyl-tRNA formyltransferase [Candidatus Margulisbacteria bacterium]|nr:methionyl-tRNA formyltransferase [Candidatus Margulisiibacteriota bacterium]
MINKLFFFGTPAFSANILQGLITNNIPISGVITGPDKKQNRGQEIMPSEVAIVANKNNITVFKPATIEELTVILKKEAPDLCLIIAYGMIFPAEIVNSFNFINIHTSLLPKYRGPSPVQSCLLNGDKITGVTLMKIDTGVDDGDIISTKTVNVFETETAESLFKKLETASIELLTTQLKKHNEWTYSPQASEVATFTKKIKKEDGYISLQTEEHSTIYRKFQAYYLWPGIYTFQDEQRIKITDLKFTNNKLEIISVQKEGKRPIPYKDFLNSNKPLI